MRKQHKSSARFIDNGDNTVTDTKTNLTWMKQDDGVRRTWKEAIAYCEKNKAKLPGKGWRLPAIEELFSLIDFKRFDPAIDPVFSCQSASYWSSTPHASYSGYAWYVDFYYGNVSYWDKGSSGFVRPVRQNSL